MCLIFHQTARKTPVKNVLKFAMQNRIKLIWRPSRIAAVTKDSFQRIGLFRSNKAVIMKNDTANWITVTDVKAGNTKINDQNYHAATAIDAKY
ncbi:periplasmic chaperone protein [Salmonella enterica subsp. enterica]|uniref:Periplasmic chaperone protein n=1 Tax=Salmonella enterica I TaxID=59201 RepID=A0A447U062_SALET|nr:periplasmic chaperone protein [Salmonella enterica subsp. enterica]